MHGTSKVNFTMSWVLTFMLVSGKLASLTDMSWWWVIAPAITVNVIFGGIAVARGFLVQTGDEE